MKSETINEIAELLIYMDLNARSNAGTLNGEGYAAIMEILSKRQNFIGKEFHETCKRLVRELCKEEEEAKTDYISLMFKEPRFAPIEYANCDYNTYQTLFEETRLTEDEYKALSNFWGGKLKYD